MDILVFSASSANTNTCFWPVFWPLPYSLANSTLSGGQMKSAEGAINYTTIQIERQEQGKRAVAWLWMHRPEVHDAFDATLIAELRDALHKLGGERAWRDSVGDGRGR